MRKQYTSGPCLTASGAIFSSILILFAAQAFALTVDEAVSTGLANNPEMQAVRLETEAASGQMAKAKLPPFSNPVIEGGMSLKERPAEEPGDRFRNHRISLSQSVEIAGQRGLRIKAAESSTERTRQDIRDLETTLRSDIKDAFAEAVFRRDNVTLSKEYLKLQEELAELVGEKYAAGDAAALEINLSQVELARAQKETITADTAYDNALLVLKNLIGFSETAAIALEGMLASGKLALPLREDLLKRATDRPDIKSSEAEVKKLQSEEALIRREAIPNITWSIFRDRDESRNEWGATLGISIPLFDRKQGERIESKVRLSQARIRSGGLKRSAEKEINISYTTALSSLRELDLLRKAVLNRTRENLDLLQFAFKEGKISFYDVRIAQRETFDSRQAFLQSTARSRSGVQRT